MDIVKIFDGYIISKIQKEDVRNYVLNHSAKEKCLSNLKEQIFKAFGVLDGMKTLDKRQKAIESMIETVANMFAIAALGQKEKELGINQVVEEIPDLD